MKDLGIALLVVVGLVVAAGVALYVYAGTEYTVCYGIFKSDAAATRAADAARDRDLDPDVVGRQVDEQQGPYWPVEFETGETGDDAREAHEAFQRIIRQERGELGHPGNGCLERGPFEH